MGATGHTGRLLVPALKERGATVVACGRDAAALAKLGVESRIVDVYDVASVRDALSDVDAVANLAGPFLATGTATVEAALRRGIPYVDTTGEQAFMARVRAEFDERSRKLGVPIVQALAYEYALADLAARAHFPEGGAALHVLYRSRGAQGSLGTKKSVLRVMSAPALGYEDGALVRELPAAHRRRFKTAQGERDATSFPGGEALTIPRHTPFRTIRSYVPARNPLAAKLLAPLARVALHGPVLRAAERRLERTHREPKNGDVQAEIHLVSEGPARRIVLHVGDPYVATAELCAEGVLAIANRTGGIGGVLAPSQAMDASKVLDALSRRLPVLRIAVDENSI